MSNRKKARLQLIIMLVVDIVMYMYHITTNDFLYEGLERYIVYGNMALAVVEIGILFAISKIIIDITEITNSYEKDDVIIVSGVKWAFWLTAMLIPIFDIIGLELLKFFVIQGDILNAIIMRMTLATVFVVGLNGCTMLMTYNRCWMVCGNDLVIVSVFGEVNKINMLEIDRVKYCGISKGEKSYLVIYGSRQARIVASCFSISLGKAYDRIRQVVENK